MIRSVRRILYVLLRENPTSDAVLNTVLIEAARIVNNRPLLKVTSDIDATTLTPNHLILLRSTETSVVSPFSSDLFRRQWNQMNNIANQFWRKWLKEYVPLLQRRQKWIERRPNLKEGDVVLISDPGTPRNHWPVGVVLEAISSKDALVRTVRLKVKEGEVSRDIRRLCLLECAEPSSTNVGGQGLPEPRDVRMIRS